MNTIRTFLLPPQPVIKLSKKHPSVQMRSMSHHASQNAFINSCKLAYPIMICTLMYLDTKNTKVNDDKQENDGDAVENMTPEKLEEYTKVTILESLQTYIPGGDTVSRKRWCIKQLTQILETFDNHIPVIGGYMDNPIVDDLQATAIENLVERLWPTDKTSIREN